MKHFVRSIVFILIAVVAIVVLLSIIGPRLASYSYNVNEVVAPIKAISTSTKPAVVEPAPIVHIATHIPTPTAVKALYMTSWVAGTPSLRSKVVSILDTTEANSVVIDIKDYTGKVSFEVNDPDLAKLRISDKRIADIDTFIDELHSKNIYVIGRLAAFQDPYMVKLHPEWAVKRASDGGVWKDYKGISWIDAGSKGMWEYLVMLAKESHSRGFDEINFDYIRFPSDGNMKDISYISSTTPKATVMRNFYEYIHNSLATENVKTSADLFGMTTVAIDDMGIGQMLVDALVNFDYVSPMVYPSHFPLTWYGIPKPATEPYKVIKISMGSAVERAKLASTSPLKLRPWLQDFNLGATYTPDMVAAQIQATYDVGLTSWMMWDPNNRFTSTKAAIKAE